MSDPNKFTVQVKLTGARAAFARAAVVESGGSAAKFALDALLNECSDVLEVDIPPAEKVARGPVKAGSRIPEANALGLSSVEYKRRVRVLETAGVQVTPENVSKVPAAQTRARIAKAKAAPKAA
jgi:hypothetical protein